MSTSWQERFDVTCRELKKIHDDAIEPVEKRFCYERFRPSWFQESLKPSKPFVVFLGPFSSGKSTFINYLLGGDYLWTGPQPTTDKFTIIMHGKEVNQLSGQILVSNPDMPFRPLQEFGASFVELFSGMQIPSEILKSVTLIDTPGVLESAKDVHQRSYDYIKVCKWFIDRADLIFCLFDPSKLDAGIELRNLFAQMKGRESKVRMVLNKADTVAPQELMRVYGALFWNMSNLLHTTEPPRVYVSSFWNNPYRPGTNTELFDAEKGDLMYDLMETVPLQSLDKRVTSVLRRAMDVQIHAHIICTMKEHMPKVFGKGSAKKELIENIDKIFMEVQTKYKLTAADFPTQEEYRAFFDKPDIHMGEMPRFIELEKEVKKGGEAILARLKRAIDIELPHLLQPISMAAAEDPRQKRREAGFAGATVKAAYAPPQPVQPQQQQQPQQDTLAYQHGMPASPHHGMHSPVPQSPQAPMQPATFVPPAVQAPSQQQQPMQMQMPQQQQQQLQQQLYPSVTAVQQPQQQQMQPQMPTAAMGQMSLQQPQPAAPQQQPVQQMQMPQMQQPQMMMPQQMGGPMAGGFPMMGPNGQMMMMTPEMMMALQSSMFAQQGMAFPGMQPQSPQEQ